MNDFVKENEERERWELSLYLHVNYIYCLYGLSCLLKHTGCVYLNDTTDRYLCKLHIQGYLSIL